jgi:hypothetical protein
VRHFPRFGLGTMLAASFACLAIGYAAGGAAASKRSMIVTPFAQVEFKAVDPKRANGPQLAVLRGNPDTGPSSMLMRLFRGTGPMHVHSSDYDLVLIEGRMKQWAQGETEQQAQLLEPGSYLFQPGNEPHVGSCLSDECLMYVQWSGKRDGRLVENP